MCQLRKKTLEVSVWDYDKCSSNDFLGEVNLFENTSFANTFSCTCTLNCCVCSQVLIDLSNTAQLDNVPRWLPLKEQSEGDHHRRSHSGQGRHSSSKPSSQHSSPKTTGSLHDNQDSPKSSVIKSRSHGIFPDPAKGRTQWHPLTCSTLSPSSPNSPLYSAPSAISTSPLLPLLCSSHLSVSTSVHLSLSLQSFLYTSTFLCPFLPTSHSLSFMLFAFSWSVFLVVMMSPSSEA